MTQIPPSQPTNPNDPAPAPKPPAAEAAERRDWPAYFDRMEGKPPRETVVEAITSTPTPGFAIDLGCGDGRDTQELLSHGWRVLAIDGHEEGIQRLKQRPACAKALSEGRLTAIVGQFEDIASGKVPLPETTLLNASFALPFCPPEHFAGLWAAMDRAVPPGGRFSGQFFGERDGWAIIEDRTHLTRAKVLDLFDGWVLDSFREEDRPSKINASPHKHWHLFHIVAKKRPLTSTGDPA
ncbi:MAG: tellurite methyltransferase [Phycisphaerales bacterium]|jgi:tellurite methyltransferase